MPVQRFEHEFNMGETVYFIIGDEGKGIVVNIFFSVRKGEISYTICTGLGVYKDCYEEELSRTKTFT